MAVRRRRVIAILFLLLLLTGCGAPEPPTEPTAVPTEAAEPFGAFLLECGETPLTVVCPAGWTGKNISPTNVAIYSEDCILTGDYYYFQDPFTWDDVLDLAQINAGYLRSVDRFISEGAGPVIDGYQTWSLIGNGQSYYYALRPHGDGVLMVGVYDFSGADDAAELLPWFLSLITEETGSKPIH